MARPEISVVVPVYGCASCLPALHARLTATLSGITERFELVLVDDCSPEDDWRIIVALAAADPRVKGLRLCRNFGQHHAIAAGLEVAAGRWVVVMDGDLQDPPEAIPALYARVQDGLGAVFARRVNRKDAASKQAASRAFGWINHLLGGLESDARIGNFSIVSHRVVTALRSFRERTRNYAMEVHWLGFPTAYVDVEHSERLAGRSAYTWPRLLRHAGASVLSQSTRPLYASAVLGALLVLGAVVLGAVLLVRATAYGLHVPGWTVVLTATVCLFGLAFVQLGIVGVYLAESFLALKRRPTFVVAETTYEPPEEG